MIIDFTTTNFRSIKKSQTISFNIQNNETTHPSNYFEIKAGEENFKILRSAFIYGANASGKSNILRAINVMTTMVVNSIRNRPGDKISEFDPFIFSSSSKDSPTEFEIEFIGPKSVRYRYLFSFTKEKFLREELYYYPIGHERFLFKRKTGSPISWGEDFKSAKKSIEKETRENQLILSKAADSNHPLILPLYLYFKEKMRSHTSPQPIDGNDPYISTWLLSNGGDDFKRIFNILMQGADSTIGQVEVLEFDSEISSSSKKNTEERFRDNHFSYTLRNFGDKKVDGLLALQEESRGTRKMYDLAGKLIKVLEKGMIFTVDELDSGFHPMLSRVVLEIFNNPLINKNNAQLLVATHDSTLLNPDYMRRDQIWFTEKQKDGSTRLFSLDQFDKDKVRATSKFGEWYLSGRFGGLPKIPNNLIESLENAQEQE